MNDYTLFPFSSGKLNLFILPQLEDNYAYLLLYEENQAILIDPAEKHLLDLLTRKKLKLSHILSTHHHSDHTCVNNYLKKNTGCLVVGPNDPRVEGLDKGLSDLETFSIGPYAFKVLKTPGHTSSHIVYLLDDALFSGDTLFGAGCGRIFDGTYEQMFLSLKKLSLLPDQTLVFCGHEYTEKNLSFAKSLSFPSFTLNKRLEKVINLREKKLPTVPFLLEEEKKTNPFFLAIYQSKSDEEGLKEFIKLRKKRNQY